MGGNEFIESGKHGSREENFKLEETIASLYSPGTRGEQTSKKYADRALTLVVPSEQAGRGGAQVGGDQNADLIRHLTPTEFATALSAIRNPFSDPAKLTEARAYEKATAEVEKRLDALAQEFHRVYARPMTMEIADPDQRKKLIDGHPTLEARYKDFLDTMATARPQREAHNATIRLLQQQGQKALDEICARENLPRVEFEITRRNKMRDGQGTLSGAYLPGKVLVTEQQLATEPFDWSSIVNIIAHETKHHEHLVLATAKSIEDFAGDKPLTGQQINAIKSKFKNEFDRDLSDQFILDVERWKAGHKLTNEERDRASAYERSFARGKATGEKEDQIRILTDVDKLLKNQSAWAAIKHLDESAKNISVIPKEAMDELLLQYRKIKSGEAARDTFNEDETKGQLEIVTSVFIAKLQHEVLEEKRISLTDREADKAGLDAGAAAK
jgi:hypothetical protein